MLGLASMITGPATTTVSALGHFISADTLVPDPGNPQALNRYAYVTNNPLRYTDPSGHANEEDAGSTYDPNYWKDLLLWLIREANGNAALFETLLMRHLNSNTLKLLGPPISLISKGLGYHVFVQLVRNEAPFDFKHAILEKLGDRIRLGSEWFEYSTPGNILYGFFGGAAGFSLDELHGGASAAQVLDASYRGSELGPLVAPDGALTLLDTPDDYYAIDFGYRLYQKAYAPDKQLTISEFSAFMVNYEHLGKMDRVTAPIWQGKPSAGWPYDRGYFNGPKRPWPGFLFPSY